MSAELASPPRVGAGTWQPRPPDPRRERLRTWAASPAALALAVVVYFVIVVDRTDPALFGVVALTVFVVAANARPEPRIDRCELAITANIALLVAFPFTKLPHDRLTSYVVLASAVAVTGSALRHEEWRRLPAGSVVTGFLFVMLASVSLLSPDTGALKQLVTIAAAALPQFLLAARLRAPARRGMARSIVALACAESVLAVAEPFLFPQHLWAAGLPVVTTGPDPLASSILPGVERSFATLGLPLPLGLLLVVALAFLVRFLDDLDDRVRVAAMALIALGIVFAGDRNALLTAVVILLCGRRLRPRRFVLTAALLLLAALIALDIGLSGATAATHFLQSGSYLHRVAAYDSIHKLIYDQSWAASVFGNGYSSTQRVFGLGLLQNDGLNVVDNEFVSMQVQGGAICLVTLIGLAAATIALAGHRFRLVAVAVVVIMLVFDSLLWPSATALTFLVFGLVLNPAEDPADIPDMAAIRLTPATSELEGVACD